MHLTIQGLAQPPDQLDKDLINLYCYRVGAVAESLGAVQGLVALLSNSAFMLGLHVVLGAMLGAALGAHNESVFMQQEFK